MTDTDLKNLRRLAKSYNITFKLPNDDVWPTAHKTTFRNISKLGDLKFHGYAESITIRSHDEPWTEQTKYRAEWLADRASKLYCQQRNEAGWRFGLENDVLRRFTVEVAWWVTTRNGMSQLTRISPKCRARVWRSEIEASLSETDKFTEKLEERRKARRPCQCPPENRPRD
jgi:hypothetical protein